MKNVISIVGRVNIIILFCCLSFHAFSNLNPTTDLMERYVQQYELLERFNDANEDNGREDLNQYVISLDDETWIEERPSLGLIKDNFDVLNKMLRQFNDSRKDKLRFYVVVASFKAQLKQGIKVQRLQPSNNAFNDLKDLVEPADLEKLYKGLVQNRLADQVSYALQEKGYTERVIYFYANIKFVSADNKLVYFLHDDFTLTGEVAKKRQQISAKCRQGWQASDEMSSQIQKAIANIITAIEVEYDGDGSSKDGVTDCGKNAAAVQAGGERRYSEFTDIIKRETKATAALLDAPASNQTFKTQYLVVDDIINFKNPFFRDKVLPDPVFNAEILPDKLNLLQGKSRYKIYVIFKSIPVVIPDIQRAEFAKSVYAQSTVAKQPNTIIIVVPYYGCEDKIISAHQTSGESEPAESGTTIKKKINISGDSSGSATYKLLPMLLMPSAYGPDEAMNALMNSALIREKSFQGGFNQAFKIVPKEYKVFDWKILWNGDAIYDGEETYSDVTGYEDLVAIRILQDKRLDDINKARDDRNCAWAGMVQGTHDSQAEVDRAMQRYNDCMVLVQKDIDNILSKPANFQVISGTSSLIQSLLTQDVSRQFVAEFAARKMTKKSPGISNALFYGERNPFKTSGDAIFTLIDIGSLVTSVVGLDFIFDGIGAVYAFSIGENEQGVLYAASFAVPLVSGGPLREALIEGKDILVKGSKGVYKSVSRKVYGLFYAPRHLDEISHLARSAFNPKAYNNIAQFGKDVSFIASVEEGILKDGKAVETINKNPDWITEFKEVQKEGPIELTPFLDSKTNGTLIDGVPTPLKFEQAPGIKLASLGKDNNVLKSIERIKPEEGWFDVVVHGTPDKFYVLHNGQWEAITHRDLYNYLKRNPAFESASGVRLISCEAGLKDLAENFAKKSKKNVKAANVKIGVTTDGRVVSTQGPGHWSEYNGKDWSVSFEGTSNIPEKNKIASAATNEDVTVLSIFDDVVAIEPDAYKVLKSDITYKDWFDQYLTKEKERVYENVMALEEEVALQWYVRQGPALNESLRLGKPLTEFETAITKTVNDALDKLSQHSGVTFRGMEEAEYNFLVSKFENEGGQVVFTDFKSTSKSEAVALTFNPKPGGPKYLGVFHGQKGIDVSKTRTSMEEVLFKNNSRFKVTKVEDAKDGVIRIHLEEIDNVASGAGAIVLTGKAALLPKLDNFSSLKTWINTLDEAVDKNLISKLDLLDNSYLSKLEADIASVSNGAALKGLIKESPDDLNNIWKLLKDDPAYSFELAKTGGTRWDKWAQGNFFKTVTKAGKDFEIVAKAELKATSSTLKTKLANKYNINLSQYEVFEQVQIKTGQMVEGVEEYFVADFVLVKKKTILGQEVLDFDNALVLETKLSNSTALTRPQTNALNKTRTASNTFNVRSVSQPGILSPNYSLGNSNQIKLLDYIKVHSDGIGAAVLDIISLK